MVNDGGSGGEGGGDDQEPLHVPPQGAALPHLHLPQPGARLQVPGAAHQLLITRLSCAASVEGVAT